MRSSQLRTTIVVSGICIASAASLALLASNPACQPSPEIERVIARFPIVAAEQARAAGRLDSFEKDFVRELERNPYDVHLHRHYQELHKPELETLIERYRGMAAERPSDPAALYLYGRALGLSDRPEGEAPLLEALRLDPKYPWAHFALIRVYEVMLRDPLKAQSHLAQFIEQCPSSPSVLGRLSSITSPDLARSAAASVRAGFAATKDASLIPQIRAVWAMEFKVFPPADHAAVRERVRTDLTILREPALIEDARALEAVLEGYFLVDDGSGLTWAIESMARAFPENESGLWYAAQRFAREHPAPPSEGDASPWSEAYHRDLLAATGRWVELWPAAPDAWLRRFRALAAAPGVPPETLLAASETLLEKAEREPDENLPAPLEVARTFVQKGIGLERVPELVEQSLRQLAVGRPRIQEPGEQHAMIQEWVLGSEPWMAYETLFDGYLKQGRVEEARATLADMQQIASYQERMLAEAEEHTLSHLRASCSKRSAELARAEGRSIDALVYYSAAMSSDPLSEDTPREAALALARELGAGDSAVSDWSTSLVVPTVLFGKAGEIELPDFELQDLGGRTWRFADLRGKVVLLNIWATWCPPCVEEMPALQRLHERIRERSDLVLLTLSVDENPGVVEPFLKKGGYTFPVVFGYDYMLRVWGHRWAIPCTWILDAEGAVRREQRGSGTGAEAWAVAAQQAMERVAKEPRQKP
jgi:pentatricopeptide repeat protein